MQAKGGLSRKSRLLLGLTIGATLLLATTACLRYIPPISWAVKSQTRAKVSKVKSDLRTLMIACESYFVDYNEYPPFAIGANSANAALGSESPAYKRPTFGPHVTTPIAYITSLPLDVFSPEGEAVYMFWSIVPGRPDPSGKIVGENEARKGGRYMIISAGPDRDYDSAGAWGVYDPSARKMRERLQTGANSQGSAFTYDPTNGTKSGGDIWRISQ